METFKTLWCVGNQTKVMDKYLTKKNWALNMQQSIVLGHFGEHLYDSFQKKQPWNNDGPSVFQLTAVLFGGKDDDSVETKYANDFYRFIIGMEDRNIMTPIRKFEDIEDRITFIDYVRGMTFYITEYLKETTR